MLSKKDRGGGITIPDLRHKTMTKDKSEYAILAISYGHQAILQISWAHSSSLKFRGLWPAPSPFPFSFWWQSFSASLSLIFIWERACDICPSVAHLFHLIYRPLACRWFPSLLRPNSIPLCIHHIFLTHSSTYEHLDWLCILAIMNNASITREYRCLFDIRILFPLAI
jgi:hypothetical protein